MEKKKPTIDEIYKLNVDGLFESTANWFDSAYQKSQAEINKDLYNKINNYTSPGESTGGNANLGGLLTSLNNSNLYPSKGYLYYNGSNWEFNTPVISGGGTIDESAITIAVNNVLSKTTWWGQKIANNKIDGPITISNGTKTFKIEVDSNGNLKFNGNIYATGGVTALGTGSSSGGSSASLGTLLTKLNSENPFPTDSGQVLTYDGSNFVWKASTGGGVTLNPTMSQMNKYLDKTTLNTPQFLYWDGTTYTWKDESEISGGSGGSIQVAQTPEYAGGSESWVSTTKLRFVGIVGTKPTIRTNSEKSCVDVGIPVGSGSGSSGTTSNYLRFYKDGSEESWNGESSFKITFGSGINATWDNNHSGVTLSTTGSSGGSSGSVDLSNYLTKTEASSTYAVKNHTHSAAAITGFEDAVTLVKVNNANAADRLANARTIWGQSFNGTGDINGHLYMGSAGGGSIQLYMNNGNMLDRTDNILHIGYGLKESSDGGIYLNAYRTVVYTDNISKHYDFKSNVFDVNTNTIHFGSEASGGKISWDRTNNAFKIEGNVYATGGITALGVSNSATTSNNVDFTFKSVTANTFNVKDSIQLSDGLILKRNINDFDLISTNGTVNSFYLDGTDETYYLTSNGDAHFNNLSCDYLDIPGAENFKIVDITSTGFNIQFTYGNKTYKFTPSKSSVTVS